ncbi:MAG: ABC transporter permease [Fimbriimonas sp.]|nr:ABC transporter permease [Fimbriimonas sp.]
MMRIWDFVIKEIRQAKRDRRLVGMLFGMPIIQLLLYGYAVTQDIRHLHLIICDLDHTSISRRLIQSIQASPEYFDVIGYVNDADEAKAYLQDGRASLALVIPRQYNRDLNRGQVTALQVLVDGSDPSVGTVATGYLSKIVASEAGRQLQSRLDRMGMGRGTAGSIDARIQFWYNPTLESSFSLVPGVICMIASNLTIFMSSMAVVRERELGTIEQLLVTPMRPVELMLGKLLPYLMMGFMNVLSTLTLAVVLFGVPMRGSIAALLGVSCMFMVGSLGMGLLISTLSKTQQQAQMLASLILMPNMLLSGFMYPVANMPTWLQPVTYFLPMRYYLTCIRGLMMKGNGYAELSSEIWPLAAISVIIFLAAVQRFHRKLD